MAVNSFNASNPPLTTKGDVYGFSTVPTRVPVGTDGQVLTADSTAATGLKWTTINGSALTLISTTTMSAVSSQTFDGVFTSTYTNYLMVAKIATSTDATDVTFRFRKSGTALTSGYYYSGFSHSSSSSTYANKWAGSGSNAVIQNQAGAIPYVTNIMATIFTPQVSTERQAVKGEWVSIDYNLGGGLWVSSQSTDSYDGFDLTPAAGTLTGTVSIYGVAK